MTYTVITTNRFERNVAKFRRAHPELDARVSKVLRDLASDPHQPHLRLHALKGALDGVHAVSVNYAYRLTLTLKITEREILLLDIVSHDEVYR